MTFDVSPVGMPGSSCAGLEPSACKAGRYQAPVGPYDPNLVQDSVSFSSQQGERKSSGFSVGRLLAALGGGFLGSKLIGKLGRKATDIPGVTKEASGGMRLLGAIGGGFGAGALYRQFTGGGES